MRPEILEVRADHLRLGDVLDEGIEITQLHFDGRWVTVTSNLSRSREPADRLVRVMRRPDIRAGLVGGTDTVWLGSDVGVEIRMGPSVVSISKGDMRITLL